jgi:hypothetical protein
MSGTVPERSKEEKPSLRALFPNLTEEQLHDVEEAFHAYLDIAWRIYERLERESPEFFDGSLDSS